MNFFQQPRATLVLLFSLSLATAHPQKLPYQIQKKFEGSKGVVVSAHPLASDAGLQMLKQGGNAVDAAIATQLALAVVYPGAGNIGGGGFMIAYLQNGQTVALDYRETAPSAAHRDMYLDSAGNPVPSRSLQGPLASGVPGTVAGLFASLKYARLPFSKLIAPAIKLAEEGFAITAMQAQSFNSNKKMFEKINKKPVAFVKNTNWKEGDLLIQPQLATTLKRILQHGAGGFYQGETARLIVAEVKRGGGILQLEDLKNYKAKERQIMRFNYKEYEILGMPMPSSGGVIVQQMMKMIAPMNIAAMGFQSPQAVQLMVEAERRAYADRATYMGDADFVKVPVQRLVDDTYLQERMANFKEGVAGSSEKVKEGNIPESEETTHISIADGEGNLVAVTTTLNGGYGSYTVVDGAGFLLNNEMDDFSVKEGVPNMYGAVGKAANAIAPGKRMLSSMTPTIVLKNGAAFMVVGTPGGTTIPTSVFQSLVNVIEFGMNADDAVNKPKFHHQWLPDEVYVEKGFAPATIESLKAMGYKIVERSAIGRTEMILLEPARGLLHMTAVADNRGDDATAGY